VAAAASPKTDIFRIHDIIVPISRCNKKTIVTLRIEFPPDFLEKTRRIVQPLQKERGFIVRITEERNGEIIGGLDYLFKY
jgi:hypothetical protein